ncbi:hypothetical protein WMY93_014516 [Mugilogobius chulae]|uniref:Fibronectin type-III domain-containing protein n=1 Tax=Mugilogobius chulae TaxID=88201 RepID=A0AAW0P1Q6_9GOBI
MYKPIESECVKTPMQFQDEPDPNENYIEDSCVAMLSFGAWVERDCWESLPFICYEDRFSGEVRVSDIRSTTAYLEWDQGPGTDHYRVEVNGATYKNSTDLHLTIENRTAGTFYSVKVFPVKCERELNPAVTTFYTAPNTVSNLRVVNVTEDCAFLEWTVPVGKADLYLISTGDTKNTTVAEPRGSICSLTPGSSHNISVQSGVNDRSQWSDKISVDNYTKPAKVSNLRASGNNDSSLILQWDKPRGEATDYIVTWSYPTDTIVKNRERKITGLPSGTRIFLTVTALANGILEGESQTIMSFTLPEEIKDLNLSSSANSINATWSYTKGSPNFTVELLLENETRTIPHISQTRVSFDNVMAAANYTVKVITISGGLNSTGVNESIFTLPVPVIEASLTDKDKSQLTFTWKPPPNTASVKYRVTLESEFWGTAQREDLDNKVTHTFGNLKSGTNYTFNVQTLAGLNPPSKPLTRWGSTDPAQMEYTLSMVCYSDESLLCDSSDTMKEALKKLTTEFEIVVKRCPAQLKRLLLWEKISCIVSRGLECNKRLYNKDFRQDFARCQKERTEQARQCLDLAIQEVNRQEPRSIVYVPREKQIVPFNGDPGKDALSVDEFIEEVERAMSLRGLRERDQIAIRDQFIEGVRDSALRRELRRLIREKPQSSLFDVREEAIMWSLEDRNRTSNVARNRNLVGESFDGYSVNIQDEDLGYTDHVQHEIPVVDETPVNQPYRRIPPNQYKEVRDHISELLRKGVIRESSSSYASPIVLVRKPDGSLRLCVDYRKLNLKTRRDAFPLPRIDESLDALSGAEFFSSIDLASGYHQVAVHEKTGTKRPLQLPSVSLNMSECRLDYATRLQPFSA